MHAAACQSLAFDVCRAKQSCRQWKPASMQLAGPNCHRITFSVASSLRLQTPILYKRKHTRHGSQSRARTSRGASSKPTFRVPTTRRTPASVCRWVWTAVAWTRGFVPYVCGCCSREAAETDEHRNRPELKHLRWRGPRMEGRPVAICTYIKSVWLHLILGSATQTQNWRAACLNEVWVDRTGKRFSVRLLQAHER